MKDPWYGISIKEVMNHERHQAMEKKLGVSCLW